MSFAYSSLLGLVLVSDDIQLGSDCNYLLIFCRNYRLTRSLV